MPAHGVYVDYPERLHIVVLLDHIGQLKLWAADKIWWSKELLDAFWFAFAWPVSCYATWRGLSVLHWTLVLE